MKISRWISMAVVTAGLLLLFLFMVRSGCSGPASMVKVKDSLPESSAVQAKKSSKGAGQFLGAGSFPGQSQEPATGPIFLKAGEEPVLLSNISQAQDFILQAGQDFFSFSPEVELLEIAAKQDRRGNHFFKFQQGYKGLNVFNRQLVVQTNSNHELVMISGQLHGDIDIAVHPQLAETEALHQAFNQLNSLPLQEPELAGKPELLIHIVDEQPVLAFLAEVTYQTEKAEAKLPPQLVPQAQGYRHEHLLVDANTGELLAQIAIPY